MKKEILQKALYNIELLCDDENMENLKAIYIDGCEYWSDIELQFNNGTIFWYKWNEIQYKSINP